MCNWRGTQALIREKLELIYLNTFDSSQVTWRNSTGDGEIDLIAPTIGVSYPGSSPILVTNKKGKYGDYAYQEILDQIAGSIGRYST